MSKKKRKNPATQIPQASLIKIADQILDVAIVHAVRSGRAKVKIRVDPAIGIEQLEAALRHISLECWQDDSVLIFSRPLASFPLAGIRLEGYMQKGKV